MRIRAGMAKAAPNSDMQGAPVTGPGRPNPF